MIVPQAELLRFIRSMPAAARDAPCHVLLLLRPWLSMRKYGPRGYLYALIDAAHAATNLLGTALDAAAAQLYLHQQGGPPEIVDTHYPFHEMHSVTTIRHPGAVPSPARQLTVGVEHPRPHRDHLLDFESGSWNEVVAPLRTRGADHPIRTAPVVDTGTTAAEPHSLLSQWSVWSERRKSARAFAAEPVPPAALAHILRIVATPLPTNLAAGPEAAAVTPLLILTDRLVEAWHESGEDGWPGALGTVRRISPHDHDIVASCMGQHHAGDAHAFLLLHAPRSTVLGGTSPNHLREVLFRAGAAAHLAYLGAAMADVGVFTVGGFDQSVWRDLGGLGPDSDVLCLVALGTTDPRPGTPRADRRDRAVAHGER